MKKVLVWVFVAIVVVAAAFGIYTYIGCAPAENAVIDSTATDSTEVVEDSVNVDTLAADTVAECVD